jgi:hypothetical protein
MLIHVPGWKPSARGSQSHRISGERSYTIHDATSDVTTQSAASPVAA